MFPPKYKVTGFHKVQSVERDVHRAGVRLAKLWYRSTVLFLGMGAVGLYDALNGVTTEAYIAAFIIMLIPISISLID